MNGRPVIAEVSPAAAIPGGEVIIRGSGLAPVNHSRARVSFSDVEAPVVVCSESFVVARVPEGATSGHVVVHKNSESSNPFEFEIGVPIADNLHPVANPALDADGNIYSTFSGTRGQRVPIAIYKIDLNYNVKPFVTEMMNATGLAFDRAGYLYVSSRHDGTIFRVSQGGSVSKYVEGMGVATGMAFDEDENLYVGDRSGTVFKISRNRQIFVFATLEPSIAAYHLTFGPEGYLYVTGPTTSSFDGIHRISPNGQVEVFYRGLGRPQGMAFDAEDNLYVAASLSGRKGIVRITPDKRASVVICGAGVVGLAFSPGRAIILASTNSLYHINWSVKGRPLLP